MGLRVSVEPATMAIFGGPPDDRNQASLDRARAGRGTRVFTAVDDATAEKLGTFWLAPHFVELAGSRSTDGRDVMVPVVLLGALLVEEGRRDQRERTRRRLLRAALLRALAGAVPLRARAILAHATTPEVARLLEETGFLPLPGSGTAGFFLPVGSGATG